MLPTPSTSHVDYNHVYEPAEDSYLFLDTISSSNETQWLHSQFSRTKDIVRPSSAPLLVEIGPGSGVIIAFLTAHAKSIFGTEVLSLAVDVNVHACRATRTTVEKALEDTSQSVGIASLEDPTTHVRADIDQEANIDGSARGHNSARSIYLSSLRSDLTSSLRSSSVDILIFNPPYVPTESVPTSTFSSSSDGDSNHTSKPTFEESSHLLALSYAGGQDGMEVTNRLLAELPTVLSRRGVAYILFCRGNRPEEVKERIRSWPCEGGDAERADDMKWKWCAETVGSSGKTAGWEKLEIVRIWRALS